MQETRGGREVKHFFLWDRIQRFFQGFRDHPERSRHATALLVGIIGVAALVLGYLGIKQQVEQPYAYLLEDLTDEELARLQEDFSKALSGESTPNLDSLKTKDTDTDGLNDYDELYVYLTSPYLQDTDGDTYNDAKEVETGNDPNCPSGQECASGAPSGLAASAGEPTVENIRQTLIDAGISASFLNLLSDEDLVKLYNETVAETGVDISNINSTTLSNISPDSTVSADTIRTFLLSTGEVTEEELKSIDDQALITIYNEALEESLNQSGSVTNE